jgi:hypothetical protein
MDSDRGQELEHPVRRAVAKPLLPPSCWPFTLAGRRLTKTLPARTIGRRRAPLMTPSALGHSKSL